MTNPLAILQVSTRKHEMRILREDGLYRHIRFQEPGTSIWHFDLVTWPGHLVITGDLEDFHFARTDDMFAFFRNHVAYINPSYWAEKLRGPQRYESYSFDLLKQRVYEDFREWCEWHDGPHAPLWNALRREILEDDSVPHDESTAISALMNFRFICANSERDRFEFSEPWEWRLKAYDFHFLLSLHAIVWGITWYDNVKAGRADAPPETGVKPDAPAQPRRMSSARRRRQATAALPRLVTIPARGDLL